MKKSNLLLNLLLAFLLIGGFTACKEDEVLEEKEGLPVADGMYMAKVGEDPAESAVLKPANVDGSGISSLERPGFIQGYMYLTAGNYNLVTVTDKQIAETLGGTLTTVSGADANNEECGGADNTEYHFVAATADGAAFTVPADGLYVVAYDGFASGTGEIAFDQIESVGLMGDATPGGWGEDTPMTTTITADGISASIDDVVLDGGAQMKFRFNCRWAIDRRLSTNDDFDNANGYSFWTNYGGSIDLLVPGNDGANIAITDRALYTVTFAWDAVAGATATLTNTGIAPDKPTFPEAMYLVGAGTAYGWDAPSTTANAEMHIVAGGADNEGLYWKIVYLEAGQGFKISAANWGDPNLGFGEVTEYDTDGVTVSDNGGNMDVAVSGMYTVVLDLRNDMTKVSIKVAEVYGMGDTFPTDPAWEKDNALNLFTVDDAAKTITSPALGADGTIRSYVSHAWLPDWWQAEFVPNAGTIEYRNAGSDDPTVVAGTAGQVVTYTFDDNTSSIQ